MVAPRCLEPLIASLRDDRRLGPQLGHAMHLPASPARFGELARPLPEDLRAALAAAGIPRLWSHQTEALEAVRRGEDVLVTTPTASGKSLIFQLPVLEAVTVGEAGRALLLFPLKALGQDQRGKLEALARRAGLGPDVASCAIYDGDTPRAERQAIRERPPRVLITNPEMLHLGILGCWAQWTDFLAELRWIVLDELHTYRGVFGSHFHGVLRRLLRICAELGADPRFIASSATAGNAEEFAAALAGRRFFAVAGSGAPREGRHLLLFRPAGSAYTTALELAAALLDAGLKTIVFTKARRITELLYSWLCGQRPDLARRVASYRSGFLPEERRQIEAALFSGRLDGVVSTSALELGIDVGGLDACVLVGYPGSVMATWQRSGRVGRAGRESVTALVPLSDALDQYLVDHPAQLVGRPLERLVFDPDNEPVARQHLVCAAAELPLARRRDASWLERHAALVGDLLRRGELAESADAEELYTRVRRPHHEVSLRGSGAAFAILVPPAAGHDGRARLIGTVDGVRVFRECHPGAIYLHGGRQFLVRELDVEGARVLAEPVAVDTFTTPLATKQTAILEVLAERRTGPLSAGLGRLRVTERVVGFERKRLHGQEVIDQQPLDLPPVVFETVGLWWKAPAWIGEELAAAGAHLLGALHAAEHAAISLLPLFALCDRGDVGGISLPLHPQLGCGGVFLYDGHPGGVGIAARAFEELPRLLARIVELVAGCPCEVGCPACVHSPKCGNGNRPLDKRGAERLLRLLLDPTGPVGERAAGRAVEAPVVALAETPTAQPVVQPPAAPPVEISALPVAAAVAAASEAPGRSAGAAEALDLGRRPWRPRRRRAAAGTTAKVRNTVLFDLETVRAAADVGGWRRTYRMLVAVGVTLHMEEGRLETFFETTVADLIARLEAADLVVGFNVKRFDYQVLAGYTGIDYSRRLRTLDLLEEVHRVAGVRIGLNHLVKETLGVEKSADGLVSLGWVRDGRLDLVADYCRRDVELLRDLYLYGRRLGHICYRDREGRRLKLPVDW